MTKVSVLFNLRVSGCELRDNYCVSFTQLFKKTKLPLYRHFSDFKSHCGFSIAGAGGLHNFSSLRRYFVSLIISTSNGSVFFFFLVFYDY